MALKELRPEAGRCELDAEAMAVGLKAARFSSCAAQGPLDGCASRSPTQPFKSRHAALASPSFHPLPSPCAHQSPAMYTLEKLVVWVGR